MPRRTRRRRKGTLPPRGRLRSWSGSPLEPSPADQAAGQRDEGVVEFEASLPPTASPTCPREHATAPHSLERHHRARVRPRSDTSFCWSRCRLDRVLCGEAGESFVATEGCGEAEKCQVVAGVAFVAVIEPAVSGQPGHGPFDDPPSASQSFAGLDALAGDTNANALAPQPFSQVGDVVGLVGVETLRLEGSAGWPHRRSRRSSRRYRPPNCA